MSETKDVYVICPHCGFKNMKPEKGVDKGSDGLGIINRIHCSSCDYSYMMKEPDSGVTVIAAVVVSREETKVSESH